MQDIKIANALLKLVDIDSIASSDFTQSKKILSELKEKGVIRYAKNIGRKGSTVYKERFYDEYVERNYNGDLSGFIMEDERAMLFDGYGDDKGKHIRTQKGLVLWSNDNIEIVENYHLCCPEGIVVVVDHPEVSIPKDVRIIGVENSETLKKVNRIKHLFDNEGEKRCLFVVRNKEFYALLSSEDREDIWYFPDYDIFGIRIYETEVLKYNQSVKLFIADDIDTVFKETNGRKLYIEHSHKKGGNYSPVTKDGQFLVSLIKKHRKIIPQEYFHRRVQI